MNIFEFQWITILIALQYFEVQEWIVGNLDQGSVVVRYCRSTDENELKWL